MFPSSIAPSRDKTMKNIRVHIRGAWAAGTLALLAGCVVPAERAYKIPPGHMPPPGQCRIWFPERPPGQQPPPGDCRSLRHHVPQGAMLIRG